MALNAMIIKVLSEIGFDRQKNFERTGLVLIAVVNGEERLYSRGSWRARSAAPACPNSKLCVKLPQETRDLFELPGKLDSSRGVTLKAYVCQAEIKSTGDTREHDGCLFPVSKAVSTKVAF